MPTTTRTFALVRTVDVTGVSGTGTVAWGTRYPDGKVTLRWATEVASTAVYDSLEEMVAIHCHHDHSQIVWDDQPASGHG